MSLRRIFITFLIFIQGQIMFSQWHQLPDPKPGSTTLPVSNGKILFGFTYYVSPSSGGGMGLYRSNNDLASFSCINCIPSQYGCCNLGPLNSINDSVYCYVLNSDGTWPRIHFTFNDYKKSYVIGGGTIGMSFSPMIIASSIANKFVYYTTGPNNVTSTDTLFFIKADTFLVKTITKLPLYSSNISFGGKMFFLNDSLGLLLTYYKSNPNKSVLIKTINYGQTWNEIKKDSINKINDFSFPSVNIGYLTKLDGSIHKTINGGTSWTQLVSPTTNSINCIKFADDTLGYIGGNSGQLWKTIDGGINWLSEVSTATTNIMALYTFSDVAYFVDASKKVFKNKADVIGIKEYEKDQAQFTIYPNPSNDEITINLSSINEKVSSIKIVNVLGEIVEKKRINESSNLSTQTLSVKELSMGTYFVVIESKDRALRKKISVIK